MKMLRYPALRKSGVCDAAKSPRQMPIESPLKYIPTNGSFQ